MKFASIFVLVFLISLAVFFYCSRPPFKGTYRKLTTVHYRGANERFLEFTGGKNDMSLFIDFMNNHDPISAAKRAATQKFSYTPERDAEVVARFSRLINKTPLHPLMGEDFFSDRKAIKQLIRDQAPANFEFLVDAYEYSANCEWYALFILHRKDPAEVLMESHHFSFGVLVEEGYEPVHPDSLQHNDLVVYFRVKDDKPKDCHWGVYLEGMVTSKYLWGYVFRHSVDNGAHYEPELRVIGFRPTKPLRKEVPQIDDITDWVDIGCAVLRESEARALGYREAK